jgi:tripeptidyl-peptidase I
MSDLLAIGCESYSVPEDIREHVDLIRPTVHFFHHDPDPDTTLTGTPTFNNPTAHLPETASLDDCDKFITPQCLRRLYSIDYKPEVPHLNSFGIGVSSFAISLSFPDPTQSNSLRKRILAAI